MKFISLMLRHFTRSALLLTAILLLPASSCRYLPQLHHWAGQGIDSAVNWYLAAKLGSSEAAESLILHASESGNLHWLSLLANMEIPDAQYYLGILTDNKSLRSKMLQKAAQQDHVEALYEIGQSSMNNHVKTQSLARAALLEHWPSQYALYQWYWIQEEYELALPWLTKVAEEHGESALLLGRYLWKIENYKEALQWFEAAGKLGEKDALHYQELIKKYWNKKPRHASQMSNMVTRQCAMQLQFVAKNLESVKQAVSFKNQFYADKRLKRLPICINEPVWLEQGQLNCKHYAANDYRITCNVTKLGSLFEPKDFTHLVVFAEQGKANVNNGIMFLDLADQYTVFVHELAHFAGFVDEYPLSEKMADHICDTQATHPNIVIRKRESKKLKAQVQIEQAFDDEVKAIAKETSLDALDLSYWQGFTNSLSMVKSRTCNNHPNQAYKFVSKFTFMEFHDQDFIPPLYLDIWRSRLNSPEILIPAYINIAHALEDNGDFKQAEKWRQHFIQFRQGTE